MTRQSRAAKTLSDFQTTLQSKALREAIEPYTVEGPFGALLDSEADTLAFDTFQTFEIEELMAMGDRIVVPVLLYLFHRMERRLEGQPSLFLIDEAWVALGHPDVPRQDPRVAQGAAQGELRRGAGHAVSRDALNSGILDVIKESCPTKIFLPNHAAREEGVSSSTRSSA